MLHDHRPNTEIRVLRRSLIALTIADLSEPKAYTANIGHVFVDTAIILTMANGSPAILFGMDLNPQVADD